MSTTFSCERFFFQAEDGIRDATVTGVQTCALPIYLDQAAAEARLHLVGRPSQDLLELAQARRELIGVDRAAEANGEPVEREHVGQRERVQIGRASCREREERAEGATTVRRQMKTKA